MFDNVKAAIAKETVLAYPDFSKPFEIYTDASSMQLGAVITQDNRPIAFFSGKLSETQRKYSVTEIELLAIVETLKEFKGMLWGQSLIIKISQEMPQDSPLTECTNGGYSWKNMPPK